MSQLSPLEIATRVVEGEKLGMSTEEALKIVSDAVCDIEIMTGSLMLDSTKYLKTDMGHSIGLLEAHNRIRGVLGDWEKAQNE